MSTTLALLTALAVGVMALAFVSAGFVQNRTISNNGTIRAVGVGVFWDPACTNETSSINWGLLAPGSTATTVLYVRNNGTVSVSLSAAFGNWNPSGASLYLTPGWNSTGYVLGKGQVVAAALSLTVSASITGITNFSYDITIAGT